MKKRVADCLVLLAGSMIQAFGLYNIHSLSKVTEGGMLGLTLLLKHWTGISPAVTGFIINAACFALGLKVLGKTFILYSIICGAGFSVFYALFELIGPVYAQIADMPLLAALVGALFIGVGAGLCVRTGGAPGGDDALAMSLSEVLKIDIQWVYLATDLVVITLSLTYIPARKLMYSLLTAVLSGQLVGVIQRFGKSKMSKRKL